MQKRSSSLYFYQRGNLFSVQQENESRTLFKCSEALIAELTSSQAKVALLKTDLTNSVLSEHENDSSANHLYTYTPYGYDHRGESNGLISGFNGHRRDPLRGGYLLGNGYRSFNQKIYRFESPDSLSPFHEGGLNTYAYCLNDPINLHDPSGHMPKILRKIFGKRTSKLKNKHSASAPSLAFDEQPVEYDQQPANNPHPQEISAIPRFMDFNSTTGGSAPPYTMSAAELKELSSNNTKINSIKANTKYQSTELRKYQNALNWHLAPQTRKSYEKTVKQHKANINNNLATIEKLKTQNQKLETPWLNDAVSNFRAQR